MGIRVGPLTYQVHKDKKDAARRKDTNINIPLPYVQGLSEKLTNIFRSHGVGTYHKPYNTIRSMLVHPKDKTPDSNKCGVIYEISCQDCDAKYVGETARAMSIRLKEHLNPKTPQSAVAEHCKGEGHNIGEDNVKILSLIHI